MLGSALQHPVETDGGDAGGEEQDSYWPSSPHREWQGGGQTRDETGDDNEYRPTVAEVEAAAAEDSAAGAGGDADVEEEVQEQEEEGAGRNAREHGGDNGRGGRGRGGRGGDGLVAGRMDEVGGGLGGLRIVLQGLGAVAVVVGEWPRLRPIQGQGMHPLNGPMVLGLRRCMLVASVGVVGQRGVVGDLEFPWGGYGVSGDGPTVPNPHGGAWEHAAAWPNIPAAAAAGGSGAGGGGSGSHSGVDMRAFMTPRVSQDELRSALVELFVDADLPFRLIDRALDVVFAVTTDNAENNNKAMRLLSGDPAEGPGAWTANPLLDIARHVRCLAHIMNIAVQEALKLDDVKEALKRLRDACSYIGWSVQRSEAFASLQRRLAGRDNAKVLRLISDSPTRWGSTYKMICRALELQQALTVFSSRTDVSDRLRLREQLDKIRLSDVHWDALVELKNFLQPFHSITKVAEASLYPTAAAVVPLYNQLLDNMEITYREPAVSPLTQALITKALGKLKKYPYGTKEELAIATFLDPRYKIIFFQMP
ncbi:unnamed protein product [Closterium sp. NIES-64]|nr:unnamed protein product [Closterium sp. NIES-64]